uniref:Prolyl 4-hydroxylase, transmembrane a n=1 Tax=Takifugu rubripes TaxID=31033 RepID=A0A674N8L2_TAKRU
MEDDEEHDMEEQDYEDDDKPLFSPLNPPFRPTRLHVQRSSICSRAYFVVVMVFFHVYILNVIGLLLYVHYNNGSEDLVRGDGRSSTPVSEERTPLASLAPAARDLWVMFQPVSPHPTQKHHMKTISWKPLIFEIPGFLTEEECRVVVQLAQLKGLMESQTTEVFSLLDLNQDGHSRSQDGTWLNPEKLRQILTGLEANPAGQEDIKSRDGGRQFKQRSKHTWLYLGPGAHHVLHTLRNRVTSLTRLPPALVELSEPLQVIRFEQGDFSNAHHDSSLSHSEAACSHTRLAGNKSALSEVSCRYLTMLFYLSSVEEGGESTFPVADNRTYEEQDGVDLTDTQETCSRGNLRIKPTAGTALLWYNHLSDGRGWMGELDEYSLHGECPVRRGVKWVAHSWVNVDPDPQQQARYQRLVAQRHQAKSGMEEHYQPLSHSNLHQDL